jgi:hypothetical protein
MFAVVGARRTSNICVRPAAVDMFHNISVKRREIRVQRR